MNSNDSISTTLFVLFIHGNLLRNATLKVYIVIILKCIVYTAVYTTYIEIRFESPR